MLDWLKTILGDNYSDDIDKKVSAEIGKGFVSKTDFNTANEAKKTLEGQITDRDKQLEELKKVDAAGLQAKINELQTANTTAKTDFEVQLKNQKLDFAIDSRLAKEGAVDNRAVKALLDLGKVSLDGENIVGLDDQIKTLKADESRKWAFATPAGAPGAGGNPVPQAGGAGATQLPKGTVIF